ncbi:MAG: tRNA (adenine-N1)-methyltransferase [Thermoplasmatota archaeon]
MVQTGDIVVLWNENEMQLCKVDGQTKKISGIGIVDTDRFIEAEWGESVELGINEYRLLKPAIDDIPDLIKREAQIVQPRMGALITHHCNICCGDTVVEGGAGSGVLSSVLLDKVGPKGKVFTYELRKDFLKIARSNLIKLDMAESWVGKEGDVTKDVEEKDVDAFIVDIPKPWTALDMADECLKNGGYFAGYMPSTNQLEKTVREMRSHNYIDIKSFESIERKMEVSEKGIRPSFDILGHAGYVAVGIKVP